MKSNDIRNLFVKYFQQQNHVLVESSSLVPENDPTLLFTNAGMVQFKDVFLGIEKRPYKRSVTVQRAVRAGGKHNDLENVGFTARHHTFFEMLGNFSFGDYFKREAIKFAWEFLTAQNWLNIPPEKLWITVHKNDTDAANIWLNEIKIDPARFSRLGDSDNFWAMGETGPSGYCSEIFYDHGEQFPGGPPGNIEQEGDRYVEIWNLVFMEFNRDQDGNLTKLPNPSIDTGMGLERISAVMQKVHSNYEIDIFAHLIKNIAEIIGTKEPATNSSLRVIADHIRAIAFLIMDGVMPSNEGRGYVLRRIIRRAVLHAHKLGVEKPILYRMIPALVEIMGDAYPTLAMAEKNITAILEQEELQFFSTLEQGLKIFMQEIAKLQTNAKNLSAKSIIPGKIVFKLYDTYGFPPDITANLAKEHNLTLDMKGFDEEMENQRKLSKEASKFGVTSEKLDISGKTEFTGYDELTTTGNITNIFKDNLPVNALSIGECGVIVLNKTPLYAESGGQIGDSGELFSKTGKFFVETTKKQDQVYLHYGRITHGNLSISDQVTAEVAAFTRQATTANHSATHLLQAALRKILGNHYQVIQKGSSVDSQRLRFDFTYFEAINKLQLMDIERLVNQQIRANLPVKTEILSLEKAKESGAMALFGEKYGDMVRVISMGDFSKELCGGTHVKETSTIGFFKIINESSIAAGVRRIEAVTGENALAWFEKCENQLQNIEQLLKASREHLPEKIKQLLEQQGSLEKELTHLKTELAVLKSNDLISQAKEINGIKVLATTLANVDVKTLRSTLDNLKQQLNTAVIVLATIQNNKIQVVVGVTKNCTTKIKANEIMQLLAKEIDGSGGGRDDMAQGGGTNISELENALNSIYKYIGKLM